MAVLNLANRCLFVSNGLVAGILLTSCGSQGDSEIPPELIEALAQRSDTPDYPPGPTGGEVGDIATDICFDVWPNPVQANYSLAALEQRCLHDFYDPEKASHELLFVASSAIWCQACQTEFGGSTSEPRLSEQVTTRYAAGLRAFAGLFQNAAGEPATKQDAQRWAQVFEVEFPFGLDEGFALGRFAKVNAQPLHMLIDTSSMKIVYKATGGNIQLLWDDVDARLAAD
jgi:hypothetical protein